MIKFKEGNLRVPRLQRPVYVVAGGMTDFRKRYPEKATEELLAESRVHDALGLDPMGNFGIKTGGATGGSSVLAGMMAVASGYASCVPVVGWERMDEVGTR